MENKTLLPLAWKTETRKVKDLIPFEYNPRILTDEKKALLVKSLQKFNLAEIPAVNLDNKIIAGHQRVKVLLHLDRGEELIDVRIPNRMLTEKEFKDYNLTSNIPTGYWDVDILTEHFEDVDFNEIGLDIDNIDLPPELMKEELISEEEDPDFNPEPPKEPITKIGDVYEFRSLDKNLVHRVVCGDSTKTETYDLLGIEQWDLLLTDPPYNVDYEGGTKEKLKIQNDKQEDSAFYLFLYNFYSAALEKMKQGASFYIFHADTEGANFRLALKNAEFKLSECLIWLKNSMTLSRQDYHWKHEPILYGWKPGAAHNWYSDRKQTTILEFDKPLRSDDHPTMKPVPLLVYLITNSTKQMNIVGDSFSGSGSTLIACEQTCRQCRAIELGENYADVNVKRYIEYMRTNALPFEIHKNGTRLALDELAKYL